MKIRIGFVSNSSSSSFVIPLHYISAFQLEQIKNHGTQADGDAWGINVTETTVEGSTSMDNFDMHHFLYEIGVPEARVTWDGENE
jgi:hypothetical protein